MEKEIRHRMFPNAGSRNDKLLSIEPGERIYVETTLDIYKRDMRVLHGSESRNPLALKGRKFSMSLFTGVSSSRAGDIRYLICIERLK